MESKKNLQEILIVDDDKEVRGLLDEYMKIIGYDSDTAEDGSKALEKITEHDYGLYLFDINMPGINGVELMDKTLDIYPDSYVIIITGYSEDYPYHDIIDRGAADYINKPVVMGELQAKVKRVEKERGLIADLKKSLKEKEKALADIIKMLTLTVELRDPYTSGHQKRTEEIAYQIAKGMGLGKEQVEGIKFAASIHDIGKLAIPFEILNKPGKLEEMEFNYIKEHPNTGYEILKQVDFPWPIKDMVRQHHERLDGSGYPDGLKEEDISLGAKIIAVADVYDAMCSYRPYRPALGEDAAFKELISNKGKLYDHLAVDAWLKINGKA